MAKHLLLHAPHVILIVHTRPPLVVLAVLHRPLVSNPRYSSLASHLFPLRHDSYLSDRRFSARAFDDSSTDSEKEQQQQQQGIAVSGETGNAEDYPSGEMVFENRSAWETLVVKLRMLIAFPWQRVRKGSVLTMKLRGLSLPKICENIIKAAYDPSVAGIYLHIDPLDCGWGKVEEIRRHIMDFKKSGQQNGRSCTRQSLDWRGCTFLGSG